MDVEEEEQQIEDPEEQKRVVAEIEAAGEKLDEDIDEDEDQNDDGELRRTVTRKTVYKIDETPIQKFFCSSKSYYYFTMTSVITDSRNFGFSFFDEE
ncbi:unnamed protein product, partial [Allacma fusca]